MKLKTLLMAALLPMLFLTACHDKPEDIKEDSTDMLALAESLLGQKESGAVAMLKDAKLKQDEDSANIYVKGSKLTAYIKISVDGGTVQAVELGKDHTSKTDAMVTEKVWSKYTENEALSDYVLWTGYMVAGGDSVVYMKGSLVETLRSMLGLLGSMIPEDVMTELKAAMDRDNKSFQLALYELDPETVDNIVEVAYKSDVDVSNPMNIMALMGQGIEVESATCRFEEKLEKGTFYRVTYTHALSEKLDLGNIVGE